MKGAETAPETSSEAAPADDQDDTTTVAPTADNRPRRHTPVLPYRAGYLLDDEIGPFCYLHTTRVLAREIFDLLGEKLPRWSDSGHGLAVLRDRKAEVLAAAQYLHIDLRQQDRWRSPDRGR